MNKFTLRLLIFVFLSCIMMNTPTLHSQSLTIASDFRAGRRMAKDQKKPLALLLYSDEMLPENKKLEKELSDPDVKELLANQFIIVKCNVDYEYYDLPYKYEVNGLPALALLDYNGRHMFNSTGPKSHEELFDVLVLGRYDFRADQEYFKKQYKNNKKNSDFLEEYMMFSDQTEDYEKIDDILKDYLKITDQIEPKHWMSVVKYYVIDPQGRAYKHILKNQKAYKDVLGNSIINQTIIPARHYWSYVFDGTVDIHDYLESFRGVLDKDGLRDYDDDLALFITRLLFNDELKVRQSSDNKYRFGLAAIRQFSDRLDYMMIYKISRHIALLKEEPSELLQLQKALERSFELDEEPVTLDALSLVLYRLGEKEKAQEVAKEGTALAILYKSDFPNTLATSIKLGLIE